MLRIAEVWASFSISRRLAFDSLNTNLYNLKFLNKLECWIDKGGFYKYFFTKLSHFCQVEILRRALHASDVRLLKDDDVTGGSGCEEILIVKAESESDDGELGDLRVDVANRRQVPRVPESDDAGRAMPGGDDVDGDAFRRRRKRHGVDQRFAAAAWD